MKYKTNWDLAKFFNEYDIKTGTEELLRIRSNVETFIKKWTENRSYLEEPATLLEALSEFESLFEQGGLDGRYGLYLALKSYLDQSNEAIKPELNKVDSFARQLSNDLQFFQYSISKIPKKKQSEFLEFEGLQPYKHFLKHQFAEGRYLLSEAEEKILNLKAKTSMQDWVKMTSELLSKESATVLTATGKSEELNFSDIISTLDHEIKEVRDSAAKSFNSILDRWSDVAVAEINAVLESKRITDELRKASRPDLFRHMEDDIESEVVDTLLESVTNRFDISKRYYEFKARLFGVEKLQYHERSLEYVQTTAKQYSLEKAIDTVSTVFGNLDKDFKDIFIRFFENGQVDVFSKKGKYNGAFCLAASRSEPVFILLNFKGKLRDVLTIAHEFGHAIHFEMAKEQTVLNFGASLATAEVASTFMEDFVLEEIGKDLSDEDRLQTLLSRLDDDISTIFRQVACYNFELEMHNKYRELGYLSKQNIGEIFLKHMSSYMGDGVEMSTGAQNWWIYWSHIRRFFYVYSYASGLLISKSLQEYVREDHKNISKIKSYFKKGASDSALNIFMDFDIDISKKTFWEKGLNSVSNTLDEAISLATNLGKI